MEKAIVARMTKHELVEYLRRGGETGLSEDAEAGLLRAKTEAEALEKDYS